MEEIGTRWSAFPEGAVGRTAERRRSRSRRRASGCGALLPDIWALVKPRRGLLAAGFVLMAINRVSGLVLPASTKFLIDDVDREVAQRELLLPLLAAVVAATLVQGVTSFALTQLLSKAAQRLIAELRRKVQAHVGAASGRLLRRRTRPGTSSRGS